jgi:phospholipid transport system substrate-binding protein
MTCRTAIRGRPTIARATPAGSASADAAHETRGKQSFDGPPGRRPGTVRTTAPHLRLVRRTRDGILGLLAGLLIGGLVPGFAAAAEDHDGARRLVDAALEDTKQVFAAPELSRAEIAQRLRALLDRYLDLPRIGRDSLGAYWRRATPEQQAGFLALFENFLAAGYSGSMVKLGGIQFGPSMVIDSADDVTVIQTDVQVAAGDKLPVLFMVGRAEDGSYRVVDVVAAAISLSRLLSADFGAVLRTNGGRFDALIDALEQKLSVTQAGTPAGSTP